MEVRPVKGLKVNCNPSREAIFGEEGVEVKKASLPSGKNRLGVLTGRTLAGFAEVEMASHDGNKHWYPTDEMLTDKGEKVVEVKFKVGRLHYAYNHFDDAIRLFKEVTIQHPRSQYAVYSANLILDIYNLRKDYGALAREGQAMMANKALVDAGFETDVKDIVEKASFKKAQEMEVSKNYEGSAKAFADFAKSYPRSQLASSANFNAGVNYERAHNIPLAIVYYQKTVNNSKPNEPVHNKTLLLLAHLYEQTAQYDKRRWPLKSTPRKIPRTSRPPICGTTPLSSVREKRNIAKPSMTTKIITTPPTARIETTRFLPSPRFMKKWAI